VGRTGALNPYAVLEPVEIGEASPSRTPRCHNADRIAAKDIREGDCAKVTRAGEVLPQILGPVKDRRTGRRKPYGCRNAAPAAAPPVEHPQGRG